MNRPKAARLGLCLALTLIASIAVFAPSAFADFKTGTGVTVDFSDPTPGAHSDITITHNYVYDDNATGSTGTTGDDLKQWILDTPAGFYGNPSAIDDADRCTQDEMANYYASYATATPFLPGDSFNPAAPCPTSAIVGEAHLTVGADQYPDIIGTTTSTLDGTIYEVHSEDGVEEVPTTLFTVFTTTNPSLPGHTFIAALSKTQIAPVTSGAQGQYQLRSVSEGPINRPDLSAAQGHAPGTNPGHIVQIVQTLYGVLDNGHAYQTNPTTCGDWNSTLYASSYGTKGPFAGPLVAATNGTASQTNTLEGTAANGGDSSDSYAAFQAPPTSVSCGLPRPSLNTDASASITTGARGGYPGVSVNITNTDPDNADRIKKFVTTLPGSISVNTPALNNTCSFSQRDANACPAASQVGTAVINSPMLSLPQLGKVYMTKSDSPGLANLSIFVGGAFSFRLDATTRFVGPKNTQIETTFDNQPPLAFTSFKVLISGGTQGSLLVNRDCPTDGTAPDDGPITQSATGWGGGSKAFSSGTDFGPCNSTPKIKSIKKCVKGKLSVTPSNILNKPNVTSVQLRVGSKSSIKKMKTLKTDKTSPFKFSKVKLSSKKYKKGKKYYFSVRTNYNASAGGKPFDAKAGSFKVCKK